MRELFKQALNVTNNNIILTIPLIIFIKVLDLYSYFSMSNLDSSGKLLLASITILFMCGVFCAGWFYMVKCAVSLSKKIFVLDEDRARASIDLFKCIPEGVGKFFLSFVGVFVILFIIQLIATPIVYVTGLNIIGGVDEALTQQLMLIAADTSLNTNTAMAAFVESLSPEQIVFFAKWSLLFMIATSIVIYLLMLWVPEIIFKTANPLKALWCSLVKLFTNFFKTFGMYIILWIIGFVLMFIYTFAVINPLSYILVSIIIFYFITYMTVLIFLYYDKKYVENYEK